MKIGKTIVNSNVLVIIGVALVVMAGCVALILRNPPQPPGDPTQPVATQAPTVVYYVPELEPDQDHEKVWCYAVEYTENGIICFVGQFPTSDPQATYLPVPTPTATLFYDFGGAVKPTP
jgi:hypothetical protein